MLFLSLDSNRFDARQRRWLRAELRRSQARCKVAYFHHPLWSSGRGYRSHTRHLRRSRFVPILQRGGVDLVLNGHVQNYERSKPLRSGRRSRKGIVYVVTGGGGARLNGFATRRRPKWSARRGVFHHRLRIGVATTSSAGARSTRAVTRATVSGFLAGSRNFSRRGEFQLAEMTRARRMSCTSRSSPWWSPTPAAAAAVSVGHSGWEWGNPSPQGQTIAGSIEFDGELRLRGGRLRDPAAHRDGGATWRGRYRDRRRRSSASASIGLRLASW